MRATRWLTLLLLAMLAAGGSVRGQDEGVPESPDEKAHRLKILAGEVQIHLETAKKADVVEAGNALEAIAEAGTDLGEIVAPGLLESVINVGIAAKERFISVLAGEIAYRMDPDAAVKYVAKFLGGSPAPRRLRRALAVLSEIPSEESGKILGSYVEYGQTATKIEALIGLSKIRRPETVGMCIAALGSQDRQVKNNAAIALGRIRDPKAIPNLINHLGDSDGNHPAFAAWALKQFDDPRIFPAASNDLKNDGGEVGDAKARIIESCSREEHKDRLKSILTKNRFTKFRYAAAVALGRLAARDLETQKLLLKLLMRDKDARVRWACFFGLTKNASPELADLVVDGLNRNMKSRKVEFQQKFRMLAMLAGDIKAAAAGPLLLSAARSKKNELSWRIAAASFWRCADADARKKVKDDFDSADDERTINRLAEILGRSRNVEEFRFLIRQFRRFPEFTPNSKSVEYGLEHMTGHFFGPYYGIWKKWLEKNPKFFDPVKYRLDRRSWRKEFGKKEREFRQTPATERAVQLGLAWLARHQDPDGALDPNKFFEQCVHKPTCTKEGARHMLDPMGTTSLASLAFLGGGYAPEDGKYKDTVRRLLTYLEVRQCADGNFTSTDRFQGYNRPIAVYAFSEAYNITGEEEFGHYVRRSSEYLTEIQNELGGWHYQVMARETDTSIMSWVLLGMTVSHKSGFPVRVSVFEGCDMILDAYSEQVQKEREKFLDIDPHYAYEVGERMKGEYQTGYQNRVSENATTCFGLMARMFLGWRRSHPFCIGSGNFILAHNMEQTPKRKNWDKYVSKNRFPSYAWYYGTLAMHQMGGRFFRQWNAVVKELLPGIQLKEGCDAGAWKVYNFDFVAGKVYSTCMGVLTLETYYRYKPFCEEGAPEEEEQELPGDKGDDDEDEDDGGEDDAKKK